MIEATGLAIVVSLVATVGLVLLLRPLASRVGLVARPDERRRHVGAPPTVGGLAILGAVVLAWLMFAKVTPAFVALGAAAAVIVAAGTLDDFHRLRWPYRMGAQTVAALIMIYGSGIQVEHLGTVFGFPVTLTGPGSAALTVVATVGIINAINMIDGVDGLAGVVGLAVTLMLGAVAAYAGNHVLVRDLGFLAGGLFGLLLFNLRTPWNPRASIFLGNSGAELLGLIIAAAAFRLTQNGQHPVGPQLAPFLVAPALIDCLTLIVRRMRAGTSPFLGDRNHLHHLLLDAGLTPTWVVAIFTAATLLSGGLALIAMKAHVPAVFFTVAFLALWAAYALATRRRQRSVEDLATLATRLGLVRTPLRDHAPRPLGAMEIAPDPGTPNGGSPVLIESED